MVWIQLILSLSPQNAEYLSELLEVWGAVATTFTDAADQPLYEPELHTTPLWQQTCLTAMFSENTDINAIINALFNLPKEQQPLNYQVTTLADQDWIKVSLDSFKPLQFGKNLWVCPSWQTIPEPQAVNVLLDPGLAFGTGTHATTAMCLQWLDAAIKGGEVIVDYGCGSGILAIAALKLGAQQAYAIDHDAQALEATQQNGLLNQLQAPRLCILPIEQSLDVTADILLANILANPLIELAPRLIKLVKLGGKIVLSGILSRQAEDVIKAYVPYCRLTIGAEQEGWVRLEGKLPSPKICSAD